MSAPHPASLHRLLHIPGAGAALSCCQEHLLPSCSQTSALLVLLMPGQSVGTWQRMMAWGCPGAVPSQDDLCWRGGGEQGHPCARQLRAPAGQGARHVLPGSPGAPSLPSWHSSASPLAGVPLLLSEIPCCPSQIPTGKATLLVRAAAARLGRARCFIWQQIIHPSASVPKQVCALHLAAACKYFPLRCGMLLPGQSNSGQARLPARSPRGLAAVSHLPLLKAFPGCFHTEPLSGCVPPGPGRQ